MPIQTQTFFVTMVLPPNMTAHSAAHAIKEALQSAPTPDAKYGLFTNVDVAPAGGPTGPSGESLAPRHIMASGPCG